MRAFAAFKKWSVQAVRVTPKASPEPERVYGSTRKMTGFLATLTPAQRERALAYRGEDTFGDPSMKAKANS